MHYFDSPAERAEFVNAYGERFAERKEQADMLEDAWSGVDSESEEHFLAQLYDTPEYEKNLRQMLAKKIYEHERDIFREQSNGSRNIWRDRYGMPVADSDNQLTDVYGNVYSYMTKTELEAESGLSGHQWYDIATLSFDDNLPASLKEHYLDAADKMLEHYRFVDITHLNAPERLAMTKRIYMQMFDGENGEWQKNRIDIKGEDSKQYYMNMARAVTESVVDMNHERERYVSACSNDFRDRMVSAVAKAVERMDTVMALENEPEVRHRVTGAVTQGLQRMDDVLAVDNEPDSQRRLAKAVDQGLNRLDNLSKLHNLGQDMAEGIRTDISGRMAKAVDAGINRLDNLSKLHNLGQDIAEEVRADIGGRMAGAAGKAVNQLHDEITKPAGPRGTDSIEPER